MSVLNSNGWAVSCVMLDLVAQKVPKLEHYVKVNCP